MLVGSGVTDSKGVARIPLGDYPIRSYRVTLSNLPDGYEAKSEYHFSSPTVNINIRKKAVQNEKDHSEAQYAVGKTMTNFTLTDTEGQVYQLSELLKTKQLVILDFWFATCEPCKEEFPFFEEATQQYGDQIALLAINPIDTMETIQSLRRRLLPTITFPMLQDTCNLYLGFDVTAFPTTVLIDADGHIVKIHRGAFASQAAFFATIEQYLH